MTHDQMCHCAIHDCPEMPQCLSCNCDFIAHIRRDERGTYETDVPSRSGYSIAEEGGKETWESEYVLLSDHVAAMKGAYRRGYNDHARSVQHWQDTHGAYRQHGEGENP